MRGPGGLRGGGERIRRTREVATVDERIRGWASGAERDLEPSPSGLLQQASQGGVPGRSICVTGHGSQARTLPDAGCGEHSLGAVTK